MIEKTIIEDKLYKEIDTAAFLSNSVATLRNDRHLRRGLPYVKLGRSIRYRGADILRYIESHTVLVEAK